MPRQGLGSMPMQNRSAASWSLVPPFRSFQMTPNPGQPGNLGILRGVAECGAEEARTRGFASLALARFAFINQKMIAYGRKSSIRDST